MSNPSTPQSTVTKTGWGSLRELTAYHWFVFIVCCLAWDLDCLDQQLFVLARDQALAAIMGKETNDAAVTTWGTRATSVFLIGWAIGGIGFGILGDRLGRVKTLMMTIFLYALFTGLSALSQSPYDFVLYRFLTGLGVGGAFAAAVVLLAETVPETPRPYILGMFQASSVLGNCSAALLAMYLGQEARKGTFQDSWFQPWRIMFLVGILPGILLVLVQFGLREPEKWKAARAAQDSGAKPSPFKAFFGTIVALLTTKPWGQRALLGLLLTSAGVIGLWGIGFFAPRLTGQVFNTSFREQGLEGNELKGQLDYYRGMTSLMLNLGAFLGIFAFSWITGILGRRPSFAIALVIAAAGTAMTFLNLKKPDDIYWMMPIMGFCQLALFGGYAIYLPELFPTKYRSTGTSFCYNAGRLLAATGPLALGLLSTVVFAEVVIENGQEKLKETVTSFRYAGVTMCGVFILGLFTLPFLPETKGKPLPE
jgi:MFS family permease